MLNYAAFHLGLHCLPKHSVQYKKKRKLYIMFIGPVKQKNFERKNAITFLPSNLNICLGDQKNRLIERILLSTHKAVLPLVDLLGRFYAEKSRQKV